MLNALWVQPGAENKNCYPDEHYVQTFLHVSYFLSMFFAYPRTEFVSDPFSSLLSGVLTVLVTTYKLHAQFRA